MPTQPTPELAEVAAAALRALLRRRASAPASPVAGGGCVRPKPSLRRHTASPPASSVAGVYGTSSSCRFCTSQVFSCAWAHSPHSSGNRLFPVPVTAATKSSRSCGMISSLIILQPLRFVFFFFALFSDLSFSFLQIDKTSIRFINHV